MIKPRILKGVTCHTCSAHALCLPNGLTTSQIDHLDDLITNLRLIPKKEHVFHAHTDMQNLYAVHSGSCKEYWIDEQGNECVTNFYFPGDIIGIESVAGRKHMFSVAALEETDLCVIPLDSFFKLMHEHDSLLKRFITITSLKMQNDQSLRAGVTANERVCDFILNILFRMHERDATTKHVCFPMSQLEISNFLGIAYETVNRIFHNLKDQKIIKMKNKTLHVLDIVRLEQLGRLDYSLAKN